MLMRILRRGLAMLGVVALASCATTPPAESATGRPALWQVADRDTTIYLFGTIHLLPKDYAWRTAAFDRAVAGSQTLVVETVVDNKNPQALVAELARLGFRAGLPPLAERVSPAKRPMLEAAIRKTGIPRTAYDRMETWAAAFMLLGTQFKDLGLIGEAGVEAVLRNAFMQAGKPVGQLETNTEQLSLFDTLPESAQRSLLEGALDAPAEMRTQFNEMLTAWARGDVAKIGATFNEDLSGSPELRDALIKRRNVNWTRWIQRRMAAPGSVFVAVGAGHLAGPDSVVAMLQRDGYRVRRIQ
ncbi:TraB/GumN family protein [Sphingomonas sp.]|uniref:TraB/GumN family protein n=1 Tax=Sphingomonas sp. TaxID=28214 RepID=UPI0017F87EFF|nr:TraB/GumN family protein [Sphingomonas sp.]MBA3511031.1 TraB/GumN family protein [Sphingomonas sp.]